MKKRSKQLLFWLAFPFAGALMIALAILAGLFGALDEAFDEACHRFEAWCFDSRVR